MIDSTIKKHLEDVARTLTQLESRDVEIARDIILSQVARGGSLYLCGNGGSSSTAEHFVNDVTILRNSCSPKSGVRAINLSARIATLTALANDYSYEECFAGQIRGVINKLDVLLCISGSGSSPNILRALACALEAGAKAILFTSEKAPKNLRKEIHKIFVPSTNMQVIEDVHHSMLHALAFDVKRCLDSSASEKLNAGLPFNSQLETDEARIDC